MRDIIFRGKRTDNGEWVEGYYSHLSDGKKQSDRIYTGYAETDCGDFFPDWYEVDPGTVCEWTGLTDKNGVKIWENDVVKTHYANAKKTDFIEQVVFRKGKFCAEGHMPGGGRTWMLLWDGTPHLKTDVSVYMDEIEVIGNVFDNPDLIDD